MVIDYNFALRAFVALFAIVDPFANIPIFISILDRFGEGDRKVMIRESVFIAFIVLLAFTLLGNYIFQFMGITLYSFKIAGGILLLIIAIEMLFGRKTRTEISDDTLKEERENVSVMPLAIPLLTGPGAITTGIVLYDSAADTAGKLVLIACIFIVFLLSYIILAKGESIHRILGKTGNKVVVRMMGLLLSAIAVQFVVSGVGEAIMSYGAL
ncbi:MAG: MarC family protein [Candidatus Altiarchaeota archaeon]|nr:MarC family protein [Candidatus Altiarchaeota archaeon]